MRTILPLNEADESGEQDCFLSCSLFSAAKYHGKNPYGQGFKSGDFLARFAKKYYSALDGLYRWNDRETIIVLDGSEV